MSLDLANKKGRAHNVKPATELGNVVAATFDSGDVESAGNFLIQVDTTAGDIWVNDLPTTLALQNGVEGFVDGTEVTVVKVSTDGNKVNFKDGVLGIVFRYVDRQGESITVVYDTSDAANPKWIAKL